MYNVRGFFSSIFSALRGLIFGPYAGGNKKTEARTLMRCECGKLLLKDAPREIMAKHSGHRMKVASHGSWWEAVKVKRGWIR